MSTTIINKALPSRNIVLFYTYRQGILTVYGKNLNGAGETVKNIFVNNGFQIVKFNLVTE